MDSDRSGKISIDEIKNLFNNDYVDDNVWKELIKEVD